MKIIQFKDGMWGAKKRGFFGWKYFNVLEFSDGGWKYSWQYYVPELDSKSRFKTKRECADVLSKHFHGHRMLQEAK